MSQASAVVAALYKFVALPDFREMRQPLLEFCQQRELRGTLLLAEEGINGTVAGSREGIDALLAYLRRDERLADISARESQDSAPPFHRMKVKLKREIVTMGREGIDPSRRVGTYVPPQQWNELLADPDLLLIDTRNDYECDIGSFEGAVDPRLGSFREFPDWVAKNLDPSRQPRVAMFCTGGIRCEKASAFMLEAGFEQVYHLQGGILSYLEQVPESDSRWQGECFVFDNRVAVNHALEKGQYDQCYACRHPITEQDKASPHYQKGVACPRCFEQLTDDQRQRFAQRQKQVELAAARQESHIGAAPPTRQREPKKERSA